MIDIQQHRLGALEQHPLAGAARRVQLAPGRTDERRDPGGDLPQRGEQRAGIGFRRAETLAQHIVMGKQARDLGLQPGKVLQIDRPERAAPTLSS